MAINRNELARRVTLREGLKKQVNIAQVKEVHRVTFTLLANSYSDREVLLLLRRYRKK